MIPIVGIDTGSAHAGGVTLCRTPSGPFPFAILGVPTRPPVAPKDLSPAVGALWSAHVEPHRAAGVRVIIEGGGGMYGRGGLMPPAQAEALCVSRILGDRLHVRCEDTGIAVTHVVASTWRARVVPRELRGHGVDKNGRPRTFIQDAHVRAALALYLSPLDVAALASRDERDAAGAVVGVVLAEEDAERDAAKAAERAARVPAPRAPRERVARAPAKPKGKASLADRMKASRDRAARLAADPTAHPPALCRGGCGRPRRGPGSVTHLRGLPCPTNNA